MTVHFSVSATGIKLVDDLAPSIATFQNFKNKDKKFLGIQFFLICFKISFEGYFITILTLRKNNDYRLSIILSDELVNAFHNLKLKGNLKVLILIKYARNHK